MSKIPDYIDVKRYGYCEGCPYYHIELESHLDERNPYMLAACKSDAVCKRMATVMLQGMKKYGGD